MEAVDDVVREAGGDVQVINGCRIAPTTECPRANLSWVNLRGADLSGAVLSGARFCNTTMPDGTINNDNR